MNERYSLLRLEREKRGWSRTKVEEITNGRITIPSLERWEAGLAFPRKGSILVLCELYGKAAQDLGLDKSSDIMRSVDNNTAPKNQEENPTMSDLIRRSTLSDLGSYLFGLVSTWPRRNHHYEELQEGINKAIIDHKTLVGQDAISALNRRQALMSLGLVPIRLIDGLPITDAKKVDTDHLLTHCAAGITACWYLRRGRDLTFVSDLMSTYIALLQPTIYSHSEAHRKAAARLLAQSFILKSKLADALADDDQAIVYEEEAIRYARLAESSTEQAIANREMAALYRQRKKYGQALPYAEKAYGLAKSNKATPKIILSFVASGLSICQAVNGHTEEAELSLKEAHDFFDPMRLILSMPYSEAILTAVSASVKQHSHLWEESIILYKKSLLTPDISALGSVQQRINYAKTEVSRDDKPRNMDLCVTLLTEGIIGAKELNSKLFIHQARECYDLLRIAWPREDAIKTLGRDYFGIAK